MDVALDARRDRVSTEFGRLGREVEAAFRAAGFDEASLPELAVRALRGAELHRKLSGEDVLGWAATAVLPPQFDPGSSFGQPPITVFQGERFHVDVLCWLSSTTSIHQHRFSGAFAVLGGGSVCCDYRFEPEDRIEPRLVFGRLDFQRASVLGPGSVQPIVAGDRSIHALFHLEHPSFTIVVRTPGLSVETPQYEYLRNGIAFDPFHHPITLQRPIEALNVLHDTAPDLYLESVAAFVQKAPPIEVLLLLLRQSRRLLSNPETAERVGRQVIARHGERGRRLVEALGERERLNRITDLRRRVRSADHRFFLALMLNVPEKAEILRLVNARVPSEAPESVFRRWSAELGLKDEPSVRSSDR
jgi:hypothetical protein